MKIINNQSTLLAKQYGNKLQITNENFENDFVYFR